MHFSLRNSRSSFPRTLGSAATCPPQDQMTHAHFGFRDFGPLTNNFNNISNPRFLRTVDLIFSGMSIVEADLACCLHFEPKMDYSERFSLMFLVQAVNLDNLLPLTTTCDNINHETPCTPLQVHRENDKIHWAGDRKHFMSYSCSHMVECLWQAWVSE
jgi:hypothetical protein